MNAISLPSMKEVDRKVEQAIANLLEKDRVLLQINASERAISHRLALYLQLLFGNWDVDCEYNRDLNTPKKLYLELKDTLSHKRGVFNNPYDTNAITVFPDIVVHKRMRPINLLIIEIKKTTSTVGDSFDYFKLRKFKTQYGYHYALFLKFVTDGREVGVEVKEYL